MTTDARAALSRLQRAAEAGELDDAIARLGVGVLVAFGSAIRPREDDGPEREPQDLDVAACPIDGAARTTVELMGLIGLLVDVTGYDNIDVGIVDGTHPVFDAEALSGVGLYERHKGAFAVAQMRALAHRRDTEGFRDLDLARWAAASQ